jgi:hypothetical protein
MAEFAKAPQLGVLFSTERRDVGEQRDGARFYEVVI